MSGCVEADLVRYLEANAGVSALVGDRIYPLMIPERATLPAIRYQGISMGSEVAHTGPSGLARHRIQLTVHAATYAIAQAVATALRRALDGKKGMFGAGSSCLVANDVPAYEEESGQYLRHVDVEPWYREDV